MRWQWVVRRGRNWRLRLTTLRREWTSMRRHRKTSSSLSARYVCQPFSPILIPFHQSLARIPLQRFIAVLSDHLTHCDQEGVDYETTWFLCTLDNCRQLLVQVCVCVCVCVCVLFLAPRPIFLLASSPGHSQILSRSCGEKLRDRVAWGRSYLSAAYGMQSDGKQKAWEPCVSYLSISLSPQNYTELIRYSTSLETLAFTADVDSRILEVFQQFQALLWRNDLFLNDCKMTGRQDMP